jgi:hypothetical protein
MLILCLLPRVLIATAESCVDDHVAVVVVVLVPATDHNGVGAIDGRTRDTCLEVPMDAPAGELTSVLKHASDGNPREFTEDWPGHLVLLDQSEVVQAIRS